MSTLPSDHETASMSALKLTMPVADPGFPRGEGANSPGERGTPTYDFAKISKKLHEIERI